MPETGTTPARSSTLDCSAFLADWRGALARLDELEARRDLSEVEFAASYDTADEHRVALQDAIAEAPADSPAPILAKARVLDWQLRALFRCPGEPNEEERSALTLLASIARDLETLVARSEDVLTDMRNVTHTAS